MTAYNGEDFDFERIGSYNTIAECHFASTREFWDEMPLNKEALCMRVEEVVHEKN